MCAGIESHWQRIHHDISSDRINWSSSAEREIRGTGITRMIGV